MTVVLGIDPGSRKTGFGIVNVAGGKPSYVSSGVIRLPVQAPIPQRLGVLFDNLEQIIAEFAPAELSIEQVFMAKSAGAALKLGHARGAAIAICVRHGLEVHEYAARLIRQAVVGTGAATKDQVQHMVKTTLGLPASPQEDAADALAAALCHVYSRRNRLLQVAD